MKAVVRHIILCCILAASTNAAGQLISFYDGTDLHLRWKGAQKTGLQGYKVYEKVDGSWVLLANPQRIEKNADLRKVLKGKTELFLKLLGAESEKANFTQALYDGLAGNAEAYNLLGAMSALNIEFAIALGDYVAVQPGNAGRSEFRITAIINEKEEEYISETLNIQLNTLPKVMDLSAEMTAGGAKLTWTQVSVQQDWIVGYRVYRSNKLLGPYLLLNPIGGLQMQSASGQREFTDPYFPDDSTLYYYVTQFNAFGMESERSFIVKVENNSGQMVSEPVGFGIVEHHGLTELHWMADSQTVSIYRSEERNGKYTRLFPISPLMQFRDDTYIDRDAVEGKYYYYYIESRSADGEHFAFSDTLGFALTDRTAPNPPSNVMASVDKTGKVTLSWDYNGESDVLGYDVERYTGDSGVNNYLLNPKLITVNNYTDDLGARSQSAYRYVVYAIDHSYNRSKASEPVRVRRPDDIPPLKPIITFISLDNSVLSMRWTRGTEEDLDHYTVYAREGQQEWIEFAVVTHNHLEDTLEFEGIMEFAVSASDKDGNSSEWSVKHKVNHQPNHIIVPPVAGSATDSLGGVMLSWTASSDDRTAGYLIERYDEKGGYWQLVADLKGEHNQYLDRFTDTSKTQQYRIRAYDKQWFESEDLEIVYNPDNNR